MKLLLFSDVHCSEPAVVRLIKMAERADILVGAGDFGTMRRGAAKTLAPFREVPKPQVYVCGNGESDEELRDAVSWSHGHVLHGTGIEIDDVSFFGVGGGTPVTPFGSWSFDLDEEQAAEKLKDCPMGCVLIVHSPPFGAVDVNARGHHLGSEAIRDTVVRCRPVIAVCGHIHESAGHWERIEATPVVNAGPAGILWDLEANEAIDTQ